jgi:hypothetical protein
VISCCATPANIFAFLHLTARNTAVSSNSHPTATEEASPGESTHADGDAATPRTTVESGEQATATSDAINQPDVKTIIDELLTYTIFYRDKCTAAELHKLIVHFYLPTEISMAKRTFMRAYEIYLTGSQTSLYQYGL